MIKLPVISRDVDLISRTAPQILKSVFLCRGTDLNSFPVAEFGFVVNCITVNRCIVGRMRAQFHRQRICSGSGKCDLRRVRRSCERNVNLNIISTNLKLTDKIFMFRNIHVPCTTN